MSIFQMSSRPISLVGGLYKILDKVLANQLKEVVVGKVVSIFQQAFVERRQIRQNLHVALIASRP